MFNFVKVSVDFNIGRFLGVFFIIVVVGDEVEIGWCVVCESRDYFFKVIWVVV